MDRNMFYNQVMAEIRNMYGDHIDIRSGDIHETVGGYPGPDHRMPVCCEVMYSIMKGDDIVIASPPKGKGANLVIRYFKRNH